MPRILSITSKADSKGLLEAVVSNMGHTVVAVSGANEEALHYGSRLHVDLALIKVESMASIELARQLRLMYDIPLILLLPRSHPLPPDWIQGVEPHSCLLEPFDEGELALAIQVALQRRRVEEQAIQRQRAAAVVEERERLAAELHDNVSQLLSFVKLQAFSARELLTNGDFAAADTLLQRIVESAQQAQAEIRQQIRDLYTYVSPHGGFAASLSAYARSFEIDGAGATLTLSMTPAIEQATLDPETSVQVLRIVQEALANVRKHAHARHVHISFDIVDNCLKGVVQDDGCGFDEHALQQRGQRHFGLHIMRERAHAIDGRLEIVSSPGHGTLISITAPLDRS